MSWLWNWLKSLFPPKTKNPPPQIPTGQHTDQPMNPAYVEAQKYVGKKETDSWFGKWLPTFWDKAGLPSYKKAGTIVGTSFAWCMLFILAMHSETGQKYVQSAMAHDARLIGYPIDFKKDGIPESAVLWINHNGDCRVSAQKDHTRFAGGSCTPEDVAKAGMALAGLGGNENDAVGTSYKCIKGDCMKLNGSKDKDTICSATWFKKELPGRVKRSVRCKVVKTGTESTR